MDCARIAGDDYALLLGDLLSIAKSLRIPNVGVHAQVPLYKGIGEGAFVIKIGIGNLTAADNSLRLNIARNTEILTLNGQRFSCPPGGNFLLVYYSVTTRSIPPQTTPRRIIVLCNQN